MRMKLLFFALFPIAAVNAQNSFVAFKVGAGSYSMGTQKLYQEEFRKDSGLPLKVVDKFPIFPSFGLSMAVKTSRMSSLGLSFEYHSTGGRLDYRDYSGYAKFDQLLNSTQLGLLFQYQITDSEKWPVFLTGYVAKVSTHNSMKSEISLGSNLKSQTLELLSTNYSFRPGVMVQRKIETFILQGFFGYEIQTHGGLHQEDNQNLFLATKSGVPVTAEWDGLRISVGIGLLLKSKSNESLPHRPFE